MRGRLAALGLLASMFVALGPQASAHCSFFLDRDRIRPSESFVGFGEMDLGDYVEIHWDLSDGPVIDTFVVTEPAAEDRYPGMGAYRRTLRPPAGTELGHHWVIAVVDPNHAKQPFEPLEPRYSFTRGIEIVDPAGLSDGGSPPRIVPPPAVPQVHEPLPQEVPAEQPARATQPVRAVARAPALAPDASRASEPVAATLPGTALQPDGANQPMPARRDATPGRSRLSEAFAAVASSHVASGLGPVALALAGLVAAMRVRRPKPQPAV